LRWVFAAFAWLAPSAAHAQQAVIQLPSADITPERQFFFMHESQLRVWGAQPFWSGTYFLTFGLGHHTELAATVFDLGVNTEGTPGNTALALGFKSVIPLFRREAPTLELSLISGAMSLTSLVNGRWGGWMYAMPSFRVPLLRTRLAAGVSYATEQLYGPGTNTFSFVASFEQPIPGIYGLSLVGEWFSGSHELGNLTVGATWHPNPTLILVLGWKVPTRDASFHIDEQAVVAEVGFFFPRIGAPPRPRSNETPTQHSEQHH
jgi:hypothetical protein